MRRGAWHQSISLRNILAWGSPCCVFCIGLIWRFVYWTQDMKRKHVCFAKTLPPRGEASGVCFDLWARFSLWTDLWITFPQLRWLGWWYNPLITCLRIFNLFLMKNQPVEKLPFPNNIILLFSRLFLSQFVIVNRWKFPKTSCETEHWISVHLFLHMLEVQDDQDTLVLSIERKNYMIRRNVILNSIFSTICSIWVASLFSFPR